MQALAARRHMSAISNLYIGNLEVPSWTKYEEEESSIFESNYLVPILWFALFCEKNLRVYLDPDGDNDDPEENRVPMLIRKKDKCITALEERSKFILKIFSNCSPYIEILKLKIIETEGKYVSLDMSEAFHMESDSDEFIFDVQNILQLFDEASPKNIALLLKMACVKDYDLKINDYIPDENYGYEYHAIGHST